MGKKVLQNFMVQVEMFFRIRCIRLIFKIFVYLIFAFMCIDNDVVDDAVKIVFAVCVDIREKPNENAQLG